MTRWPVGRLIATGACTLLILLAGFGSWSVMAQIEGAVMTTGRVEVDRNRQVVQHPFGGIVSTLLVAEGDVVTAGDILIRLDGGDLRSEMAILDGQMTEVLASRARSEAERDNTGELAFDPLLLAAGHSAREAMAGQERLFRAGLETQRLAAERLALQRVQTESLLSGIDAQQSALITERALVARELAAQQNLLARGLTPASVVLALRRDAAGMAGRAGELSAQTEEARARIAEIDLQIMGLATDRREQAMAALQDLQARQVALSEQRRMLARQIDRLEITAPVSGIVYDMQVFAPRSVIQPAAPLLYVVPQDRPFVIATRVRASDIDQIRIGQDVGLRFIAFDQRHMPDLSGTIAGISADVFHDETVNSAYYRAVVHLNAGEADRLPPGMTLRPGMPVDVFARTGKQRPIQYLVAPLSHYFHRALRDG